MLKYNLAIVGGGPRCVYALERISADMDNIPSDVCLNIYIFEKTGYFGDGFTHSRFQAKTSYLNRISKEFAFAGDNENPHVTPLRNIEDRENLFEWSLKQKCYFGNNDFVLEPETWPKRYVHGIALNLKFKEYVQILHKHPNINTEIISQEVTNIKKTNPCTYEVSTPLINIGVNEILLITGHGETDSRASTVFPEVIANNARLADNCINYIYPLLEKFPKDVCYRDVIISCVGMGLTAIDMFLHLTEGRSGIFKNKNGSLEYHKSGDEPLEIYCLSRSGNFPFVRPSYKAHKKYKIDKIDRGRFFNKNSIDVIRKNISDTAYKTKGKVKLCFSQHILPLVIVEMAYVYYQVMYSKEAVNQNISNFDSHFNNFLLKPNQFNEPTMLLIKFEESIAEIRVILKNLIDSSSQDRIHLYQQYCWLQKCFMKWNKVITGKQEKFQKSLVEYVCKYKKHNNITSLEYNVAGNKFDWSFFLTPIPHVNGETAEKHTKNIIRFLKIDITWAKSSLSVTPVKACCDIVWRELRSVILYAVEDGGLEPDSHRDFDNTYITLLNRLSNGCAPEVMSKVLALLEVKVLKWAGLDSHIIFNKKADRLEQVSSNRETVIPNLVVDARQHKFNVKNDKFPLYRNMISEKLISCWMNVTPAGSYQPGGINVNTNNNPINENEAVDKQITILGPATEGVKAFQFSAFRPDSDHHVMQEIGKWQKQFFQRLLEK